jgi:hypothetical protein
MVRKMQSKIILYLINNRRRSFLGQCPPLLMALALLLWKLPASSPPTRVDEDEVPVQKKSKLARIDFLGASLLASTIVTFLLILNLGPRADSAQTISILAVILVVLIALFILVERRRVSQAIFPLSLLTNRDVITAYLIAALQVGAQCGVSPTYFVDVIRGTVLVNDTL